MTIEEFVDKVLILTKQNEYARPVIAEFVLMGIAELISSGVSEEVAYSQKSLGFLVSYCVDMDTPNAGNIKMSDYTKKKLIQLATISKKGD